MSSLRSDQTERQLVDGCYREISRYFKETNWLFGIPAVFSNITYTNQPNRVLVSGDDSCLAELEPLALTANKPNRN